MTIDIYRDQQYARTLEVISEVGLFAEEIEYIDTAPITTQVYIRKSAVEDIRKRLGEVPVYHNACAFNISEK